MEQAMANIKTVKPAGGGDYTTLQAWEDFADGEATADQWAECYSGGDLGTLAINSWVSTPTASLYARIYVADGEGHGGDQTAGAYAEKTSGFGAIILNATNFIRIEGLRLETGSPSLGFMSISGGGCIIDGILGHGTSTGSGFVMVPADGTIGVFRNCIGDIPGAGNSSPVFALVGTATSTTASASFENCTALGGEETFSIQTAGNNITLTLNCTNCIGIGTDGSFKTENGYGSGNSRTLNLYNCVSNDGTADDFNGSGNIVGATDTDVFVDPANNSFFLKDASVASGAGIDLSADFTTDLIGNTHNVDVNGIATDFNIGALATYPLISEIKPAGGGAYTTLQAWEDAVDGDGYSLQWAECYSGGNMGAVSLQTWTATPTALIYPRIYVAAGEGHGGSDSAGAYCDGTTGNGVVDISNVDYFRVEGIRVSCSSHGTAGIQMASDNCIVDSAFVKSIGATQQLIGNGSAPADVSYTYTVRNCTLININTSSFFGIVFFNFSNAGTNTANYNIMNNSIKFSGDGIPGLSGGITVSGDDHLGGTSINNSVIKNNIITGDVVNIVEVEWQGSVIDWNRDYSNNITEDATGDDYGATDSLINQSPGALLVDPSQPYDLKAGSNALKAGVNLTSLFTNDADGTTRPATDIAPLPAKSFSDVIQFITPGTASIPQAWDVGCIQTSTAGSAGIEVEEKQSGIRVGSAGIVSDSHKRDPAINIDVSAIATRLDTKLVKGEATRYG